MTMENIWHVALRIHSFRIVQLRINGGLLCIVSFLSLRYSQNVTFHHEHHRHMPLRMWIMNPFRLTVKAFRSEFIQQHRIKASTVTENCNWNFFLLFTDMPVVTLKMGSSLNPDDIKEGDDVYFECLIQSNPKFYKLSWFHNVRSLSFFRLFLKNIFEIKNLYEITKVIEKKLQNSWFQTFNHLKNLS